MISDPGCLALTLPPELTLWDINIKGSQLCHLGCFGARPFLMAMSTDLLIGYLQFEGGFSFSLNMKWTFVLSTCIADEEKSLKIKWGRSSRISRVMLQYFSFFITIPLAGLRCTFLISKSQCLRIFVFSLVNIFFLLLFSHCCLILFPRVAPEVASISLKHSWSSPLEIQ